MPTSLSPFVVRLGMVLERYRPRFALVLCPPSWGCYAALLPRLSANGTNRAFLLCTPSFARPTDSFSLLAAFGRTFMEFTGASEFQEMPSVGIHISQHWPASMEWTLFRVGQLTNNPAQEATATFSRVRPGQNKHYEGKYC